MCSRKSCAARQDISEAVIFFAGIYSLYLDALLLIVSSAQAAVPMTEEHVPSSTVRGVISCPPRDKM